MDTQIELLAPPPKCIVTASGVQFDLTISFEEWAAFGQKLNRLQESLQWIIGDWLNWGHSHYERNRYALAIESLPYQYQTLRNFAWVAGRFELSRRRDNLCFSHHAEVAALDEKAQERYLTAAEKGDWSHVDLRQAIRQDQAIFERDSRPAPEKDSFTLATQLHLWLAAQDFEAWPQERRQFWKHELKPIAEVYERL